MKNSNIHPFAFILHPFVCVLFTFVVLFCFLIGLMLNCALCQNDLPTHPIIDNESAFCCAGCHTVFRILSVKGQLNDFQNTSIFQQAVRSGLISNPALLEQIRQNRVHASEQELQRLHLEITDLWCPACAEIIRLILLQEKGVVNCVVDYATDLASIEFSPRHISKQTIVEQIQQLGYQPIALDQSQKSANKSLYLRFAIASFCALNAMMFAYPLYATFYNEADEYGHLFAWLSLFCALPVVSYCAWPIFKRFLTSLRVGIYGMETLIVIGVSTAFGLSLYEMSLGGTRVYFDSLTVIIAFVLLGKIIESRAKFSAKDSLFRLAKSLPRRGRKCLSDGSQQFVPVKDLQIGDLIAVFAGEKLVLDGEVVEGHATCDESLMTGESIPVQKAPGSKVLGGAIVQNGSLIYKVSCSVEESILNKILEMVQQEIGHKTVYVRAVDQVVRWFVPFVLMFAVVTAFTVYFLGISDEGKSLLETALIRAVSVLLISCPCAIGIAAPLAEAYVLNGLAALGVIVRNRGCLKLLGKESVFVFDKTGTVTNGHFVLFKGLESLSLEDRAILKGLTSRSMHPVSVAITNAIASSSVHFKSIQEYAGMGLKGGFEGGTACLGSADFFKTLQIQSCHQKTVDMTTVYFAIEGSLKAELLLGDQIRPEIQELLQVLKPADTVLLSGDSENVVARVANSCGFKQWKSHCSPLEKRDFIDELRSRNQIVCMIGDGINDAPALTAAQIGISVVSATDISIQVSDILLTTDRLSVIPKMRSLAIKGQQIVQQNLFWAFFYNVGGLALAAAGLLSPIFAAFAMMASSLMVLLNSMRCKMKNF